MGRRFFRAGCELASPCACRLGSQAAMRCSFACPPRQGLVMAACLVGLLISTSGWCKEAPDRVVRVMVQSSAHSLPKSELIDALESQLGELDVEALVSSGSDGTVGPGFAGSRKQGRRAESEGSRSVLAFVFIESTDGAITVHFYEPAGSSFRERRIPVSGTNTASIEEVALVVRSAVKALLERQPSAPPQSVAAAKPPPPLDETVAPPEPAASGPEATAQAAFVELGLGYTTMPFAREASWQHGIALELSYHASSWWQAGLSYAWLPALTQRADGLEVNLERHPLQLFGGVEQEVGHDFFLDAHVGLFVDPISRTTRSDSQQLDPAPRTVRVSSGLLCGVGVAWEPLFPLRLIGSVQGEFLLNRFDFVVAEADSDGTQRALLSPWPVRPRLTIGAALSLP